MLTHARTAMTGAQNAGRIQAMYEQQELGIQVQKEWIATLDSHTRDTHADLDGQIVDIDKPFTVDGMTIMYPGDPDAPGELVYNCRCTLGYHYPKYQHLKHTQRYDNEAGKPTTAQTFREWQQSKIGNTDNTEPISVLRTQVELSIPKVYTESETAELIHLTETKGRYAGKVNDAQKWKVSSIRKSIRSYQKTADEHLVKITNPRQYDVKWDKHDIREKIGLLRKWRKDYDRNNEQAELMRYVLKKVEE